MSADDVNCDKLGVLVLGDVISLALGVSDEHEPRATAALTVGDARRLAGALSDAARFVVAPPRRPVHKRR